MDSPVTVCSSNTKGLKYGLGMDALVTVCNWNAKVIKLVAWTRVEWMFLDHECGASSDSYCSSSSSSSYYYYYYYCYDYSTTTTITPTTDY